MKVFRSSTLNPYPFYLRYPKLTRSIIKALLTSALCFIILTSYIAWISFEICSSRVLLESVIGIREDTGLVVPVSGR